MQKPHWIAAFSTNAAWIGSSRPSRDKSSIVWTALPLASYASVQQELFYALDDPLMEDFSVELHDAYITAEGTKKRPFRPGTDAISFRLDLGAVDGHLTAEISEATINNFPIPQAITNILNGEIAANLIRDANRDPDNHLESVVITDDGLTLTLRVETDQSRGR